MEKSLHITLELTYFILENLKSISLVALENLLKNKFLMETCELMKNKKTNEKATEVQRLLTEAFVNLIKIKDRVGEMRKEYI